MDEAGAWRSVHGEAEGADGLGETVLGKREGAGGAGDIFEIEHECVEQRFLADASGSLPSLGFVEIDDAFVHTREKGFGFAGGREVGGIVTSKSLDCRVSLKSGILCANKSGQREEAG